MTCRHGRDEHDPIEPFASDAEYRAYLGLPNTADFDAAGCASGRTGRHSIFSDFRDGVVTDSPDSFTLRVTQQIAPRVRIGEHVAVLGDDGPIKIEVKDWSRMIVDPTDPGIDMHECEVSMVWR